MTEWKERCYATHCGCCFLNQCFRDQPRDVLLSYSSLEKEIWTEESSSDTREWVVFRCQARFPRCEEVCETESRQKFRPVTNKMSPRSSSPDHYVLNISLRSVAIWSSPSSFSLSSSHISSIASTIDDGSSPIPRPSLVLMLQQKQLYFLVFLLSILEKFFVIY